MKVLCRYWTPEGRCQQDSFHMVKVSRYGSPDQHWTVCNEHFHALINSPLVEAKHLEINKENFQLCLADEIMTE